MAADEGRAPLRMIDEPMFRRFWYPVAMAESVAHEPLARRLLGVDLVLWRPGGDMVSAAVDRCPHRDARLSSGWLDDCRLVCPYHGWEYDHDGRAVRIPQLDEGAAIPPRARLETVRVAERLGWVWVCLDEPVLDIPDLPEFADEGWRVVHERESHWDCAAPLIIENNFDPAHIAFVHRESFGTPEVPEVPVSRIERIDGGMRSFYEVPVQARPGEGEPTVRTTVTSTHGPLLMLIRIEYPDDLVHLMVKACTPEDDTTTRQLQTVIRSDGEAERPAADIRDFDEQVWREDKSVLEGVRPVFHLDLRENVHLAIDKPSIEYRRYLAELTADAG